MTTGFAGLHSTLVSGDSGWILSDPVVASTIVQAETLTLLRNLKAAPSISTASLVTCRKAIHGHALLSLIGEIVVIGFAQPAVIIHAAIASAAHLLKSAQKPFHILSAQAVTLARGFFIRLTQASVVTLRRSIAAHIRVLMAQSVVIGRHMVKLVPKITMGEVITFLAFKVQNAIFFTTGNVASIRTNETKLFRIPINSVIVRHSNMLRRLIVRQGQSVNVFKAAAGIVLRVLINQAVFEAFSRRSASVITMGQHAVLHRNMRTRIRALGAQAITLRRNISRRFAIVLAELVTVKPGGNKLLRVLQAQVMRFNPAFVKPIPITMGSIVRIDRRIRRLTRLVQAQALVFGKTAGRFIPVHSIAQVIRFQRAVRKIVRLHTKVDVIRVGPLIIRRVYVASGQAVQAIKFLPQRVRVLTPSQAALVKETGLIVLVASGNVARLVITWFVTLRAPIAQAITLIRHRGHTVRVSITQLVAELGHGIFTYQHVVRATQGIRVLLLRASTVALTATRLAVGLPRVRTVIARTRRWVGKLSSSFDGTD